MTATEYPQAQPLPLDEDVDDSPWSEAEASEDEYGVSEDAACALAERFFNAHLIGFYRHILRTFRKAYQRREGGRLLRGPATALLLRRIQRYTARLRADDAFARTHLGALTDRFARTYEEEFDAPLAADEAWRMLYHLLAVYNGNPQFAERLLQRCKILP